MKEVSFMDVLNLNIGLLDKLLLLNRYLLPQEFVEWVLIKMYSGNIPDKYKNYFLTRE